MPAYCLGQRSRLRGAYPPILPRGPDMVRNRDLARCFWRRAALLAAACLAAPAFAGDSPSTLLVTPNRVELAGNFSRSQLLVADSSESGSTDDLTSQAKFKSSNEQVARVNAAGQVVAVGDGEASIEVAVGDARQNVPVKVSGVTAQPAIRFSEQITPILNKAGCAMAACHAAQHGQGGFKLSVFASEPDKDRAALIRDAQQRRADFVEPERSLLLLKPTMQTPHGGGKRLEKGSVDYQVLLAWLKCGAPGPQKGDPQVVKLSVTPAQRIGPKDLAQQLRVVADYSSGVTRDVTAWARFDSLDDGVVNVSPGGLVKAVGQGQAPVMVRFEGQAATSLFVIPY